MTALRVRHLATALHSAFDGLIDLADVETAPDDQREKALLTRALAAQALHRLAGIDASTAASAVTDGTGDNGIDAVFVDSSDVVILVQSKWDRNGTGGIGLGDARNFIAGLKDLTDERYDRFNEKFRSHVPELQAALGNPEVKFVMVVATSGTSNFADPVSEAFGDMERELNDPTPLVRVEALGIGDFHAAITAAAGGQRIDLDVTIENWGVVTEPYEAYYGTVSAQDVAAWFAAYGDALFEQNIRKPLGTTSVNIQMGETLTNHEQDFWYFNNGITGLCGSIQRLARGATSRNHGEFHLSGVSIVNGAQTVAAIARAAKEAAPAELSAQVWVRLISLEGCPPEFATQVTEATNTQNAVERSDFVALDPEQGRLRTELLLSLQKIYSIKRGEDNPQPEHGCTVTEATVGLACSQPDSGLAVIAKSAVGRLWESTARPPYAVLFNPGVSAFRLWRSVEVARAVERRLEERRAHLEGRARSVAVQGNRITLHLVFRKLDLTTIDNPDTDWAAVIAEVPAIADSVLELLIERVESEFPGNYITSLFKNAGRCSELVDLVLSDAQAAEAAAGDQHS